MTVREQSDGLIPNKQTPPATASLGTSASPWDEVYATALYRSGVAVARVLATGVDLAAGANTVTHNLNNSNPVVQVYGSGTNEQYFPGSGTVMYTAISGSTANAVIITMNAAAPGSTVVVIG